MTRMKRQTSSTPAAAARLPSDRRCGCRIVAGTLATAWLLLTLPAATAEKAVHSGAQSATVGITAEPQDTPLSEDLASLLGPAGIRVIPVVGRGPFQDADDLLHLKGIDFAILPSDIFGYPRREALLPEAPQRMRLVLKLYDKQFHLLARNDIPDIAALSGRKVGFGLRDSGDAATATMIFETLGVTPQPVFVDERRAVELLKDGELAAVAALAAKPDPLFHDLNREQGIRFLPVRMTPGLHRFYREAELGIQDYPLMIGAGEAGRGAPVPTVGMSMVLAAYDFPPEGHRSVEAARFVQALSRDFPSLLVLPYDARWKQADPAALPPGWIRYAPAVAWSQGISPSASGSSLPSRKIGNVPSRNQIFEDFLRWERQRGEDASGGTVK